MAMNSSTHYSLRDLILGLSGVLLSVASLAQPNYSTASTSPFATTAATDAPLPGVPGNARARARTADGLLDGPNALQVAPLTPSAEQVPNTERAGQARKQPNQFQRFVKDATGQQLELFGSSLFSAPNTYTPVTNISPPASYLLGVGDEVQLQVWGGVDLSTRLTVDRNGQVQVPRVGALTLAGVSVAQLNSVFKAHLAKVFTNIELAASVANLRAIQVYVVGQAEKPGTYTLSSLSTLVNALFASGGPSANGSMRSIELRRQNQLIATLDLYAFITKGEKAADVALQPGDVIVIPPVGARVAVTGAYDQAAIYELKGADTTVEKVLSIGGGVPALSVSHKALLERVTPTSNPPRQVAELTFNAIGLSTPLKDGDILTLINIPQVIGSAVTLRGNVAYPLRHRWKPGMRVLDLIPEPAALITQDYYRSQNQLVQVQNPPDTWRQGESQFSAQQAGAPKNPQSDDPTRASKNSQADDLTRARDTSTRNQITESSDVSADYSVTKLKPNFRAINWDYAVIERLDPITLVNQLIPFNLGKALLAKDPAHNLPLLPGDVVTVFNQKDIRLSSEKQLRLVRVEGEVAAPGIYPSLPGETLPQLLDRIGGLTSQAYVFGTEFSRQSVREQQQKNLDQLVGRLEATLSGHGSAQIANLSGDQASRASALMEDQRQRQQQQIARLKTLRSNGRVALEMPLDRAELHALPSIPLEDGDMVFVPSTPSFVAAYGSVNNQNAIVFRPGRTVADVLRLAGVSEDADVSQAFVLRADGTVVANKDNSTWFGGGFEGARLMPGDTVVVPAKVDRETFWTAFMRNAKDITQILSNLGLGVAAVRSL